MKPLSIFRFLQILTRKISEVPAPDLADFFTKGVFHDTDHGSEINKRNDSLTGLGNPERFYSREKLYFIGK